VARTGPIPGGFPHALIRGHPGQEAWDLLCGGRPARSPVSGAFTVEPKEGQMWSNTVRGALLVADAFVALTALGGGIALATGLEAKRFPVEWQRVPRSAAT
jgi:hypothetical protein